MRRCVDVLIRLHHAAQRRLQAQPTTPAPVISPVTPPRLRPGPRKLLVLDLDETLVHSVQSWSASCHCDFTVTVTKPPAPPPPPPQPLLDDSLAPYTPSKHDQPVATVWAPPAAVQVVLFVSKRPHLDAFLRKVRSWYDVAVLTSSSEMYASQVLDRLDSKHKLFTQRHYRSSCIDAGNGAVQKDLRVLTDDLSRVLLVDNSAAAFTLNPENVLPISSWLGDDPDDEALLDLLPFLFALRFVQDVRSILGLRLLLSA